MYRYKSIGCQYVNGTLYREVCEIATGEIMLLSDSDFDEISDEKIEREEYEKTMKKNPIDPEEIFQECSNLK